jgi:hypothetical protein
VTAGDSRCRWHEDPNGRCGDPVAFPTAEEAPPFCVRHLLGLEPWIRTRAARKSGADEWIAWAARRAAQTEDDLKALGAIRPSRAIDDGRPLRPAAPERR